jgi:hypothetical protein
VFTTSGTYLWAFVAQIFHNGQPSQKFSSTYDNPHSIVFMKLGFIFIFQIEGQCQCKGNVEGRTCDTCKHLHYNLSSSNSNGCTRSPCYENGTTHCSDNATCATCVCKTNVKGADCNECEQNHYGINVLADGCVPCQCNISGTLNRNLSCNLTTGQCNCKLQVEGRFWHVTC